MKGTPIQRDKGRLLRLFAGATVLAILQGALAADTANLYLPKGAPFKLRFMGAPKLILEPLPPLPIVPDPQPVGNPQGAVGALPELPSPTTRYEAKTHIIQVAPIPVTPGGIVNPNLNPSGFSLLRYFPVSTNATTIIDLNALHYFQPPIRGSKATYQK